MIHDVFLMPINDKRKSQKLDLHLYYGSDIVAVICKKYLSIPKRHDILTMYCGIGSPDVQGGIKT